jgi:hypothetical protein
LQFIIIDLLGGRNNSISIFTWINSFFSIQIIFVLFCRLHSFIIICSSNSMIFIRTNRLISCFFLLFLILFLSYYCLIFYFLISRIINFLFLYNLLFLFYKINFFNFLRFFMVFLDVFFILIVFYHESMFIIDLSFSRIT